MPRFTVHAETLLSFEIEHAGGTAILAMEGGEWRLTRTIGAGSRWLCQGRVEWHESLRRALIELVR